MNNIPLDRPNFLIIGAGKSGTTALHKYLRQHPQVFMPELKEPCFFAVEGQTPVDPAQDPEEHFHYPQAVYTLDQYQELFREARIDQVAGEASTMYLYKPGVAERIKHYVPNVKMMAIFRNPAERLYSRYLHLARVNRLPDKNLENIFDKKSVWWKRHDLVYEGFYYKHLKKLYQMFDHEQIKIFLYEDMKEEGFYKEVYDFLGVDNTFVPQTDVRYNRSGFIKNRFVDYWIGDNSLPRRMVESVSPAVVRAMRNSHILQKTVNRLRNRNLDRPKMENSLKQRIINEIYEDDLIRLQELIGRDLTHWMKSE